jgi:hypothetical protein
MLTSESGVYSGVDVLEVMTEGELFENEVPSQGRWIE